MPEEYGDWLDWLLCCVVILFVSARMPRRCGHCMGSPKRNPDNRPKEAKPWTVSYHSGKWYRNHPNVHKPNTERTTNNEAKAERHPLLDWLQRIGVGAMLLGGTPVILPQFFWPSMACFYIGLLVLLVDALCEPNMRRSRASQVLVISILAIAGLAVARYLVFVSRYKVQINAHIMFGNYPTGTSISGILTCPQLSFT